MLISSGEIPKEMFQKKEWFHNGIESAYGGNSRTAKSYMELHSQIFNQPAVPCRRLSFHSVYNISFKEGNARVKH